MKLSGSSSLPGRAQVLTWLGCGVALLGTAGILAFSWLFAGFGCDEGCYESGSWTTADGAWQWSVIGWLALAAAVLAAAALRRARRGGSRAAWLLSAIAVGVYAAEWVLVNHASANTAGDLVFWLLAEVVALLAAVAAGVHHRRLTAHSAH